MIFKIYNTREVYCYQIYSKSINIHKLPILIHIYIDINCQQLSSIILYNIVGRIRTPTHRFKCSPNWDIITAQWFVSGHKWLHHVLYQHYYILMSYITFRYSILYNKVKLLQLRMVIFLLKFQIHRHASVNIILIFSLCEIKLPPPSIDNFHSLPNIIIMRHMGNIFV